MGPSVLEPGIPNREGLHVYAHCLPATPGGVALLAINNSRTQSTSITLPVEADRFTLSANELEGSTIQFNGQDLVLGSNDDLPTLSGKHIPGGPVEFAPASITFLAIGGVDNESCW